MRIGRVKDEYREKGEKGRLRVRLGEAKRLRVLVEAEDVRDIELNNVPFSDEAVLTYGEHGVQNMVGGWR